MATLVTLRHIISEAGGSAGRGVRRTWVDPRNRAGWWVGGLAGVRSFQPSLQPRPAADQGVVTGLSLAAGFGVGRSCRTVGNGIARAIGSDPHGPAPLAGTLAAAAGLAVAGRPRDPDESVVRSTARTAGRELALVGAVSAASDVIHVTLGSRKHHHGRTMLVGLAVLGVGAVVAAGGWLKRERLSWAEAGAATVRTTSIVAGTTALALAVEQGLAAAVNVALRRLAPPFAVVPMAGHWVVAGVATAAGSRFYDRMVASIATTAHEIEPGFADPPTSPLVSTGPGSALAHRDLGRHGRRFVGEVQQAERIADVLGVADAHEPIRVYIGERSVPTLDDQVDLAMDELERCGAFEREWILVTCPTGSGLVDFAPVETLELMTGGNCATVVLQYASLLSALVVNRVEPAAQVHRALLIRLRDRIAAQPEATRPRLGVFGLSLGAWISQESFAGTGVLGLHELCVDAALWFGTPFHSAWRIEVFDGRRPLQPCFDAVEIDHVRELDELPVGVRPRAVLMSHYDDPVRWTNMAVAVRAPHWLGPRHQRPPKVPPSHRWTPLISLLQLLVDGKNSIKVVPGEFAASGHNYRADTVEVCRRVFGPFELNDAQLARVAAQLRRNELDRAARTCPSATARGTRRKAPRRLARVLRLGRLTSEAGTEVVGHMRHGLRLAGVDDAPDRDARIDEDPRSLPHGSGSERNSRIAADASSGTSNWKKWLPSRNCTRPLATNSAVCSYSSTC